MVGFYLATYRVPKVGRLSYDKVYDYTILLVFWPVYCVAPIGTYPPICTEGCALYTDQNPVQSCTIIFCRDPYGKCGNGLFTGRKDSVTLYL